ncbi:MAG TPA: PQQ-binding-like beta-propeller repeat protein [Phenylobacterium sp.]|nr:PQQ-binding-like beta-propeller repeat protein [Phenylobacterium sp.]
MSSVKSGLVGLVLAAVAAVSTAGGARAQAAAPPSGQAIFDGHCKACHEPPVERAPGRDQLALRPQADIEQALTTGVMAPMAQGLSPEEIHAVAGYLTNVGGGPGPNRTAQTQPAPAVGREMPTVAVKTGPVGKDPMCAANPPIQAMPGDWATTGIDDGARRFQQHPGLTKADLPRLKLKWAFAMTGGGQPTVVGDWLFITNRSGKFYALDAQTGCVHWVVDNVVSRTAPIVLHSRIAPSGWLTVISESDRIVRAYDAQTGKPLWTSARLEDHPISVLTGSPIVAGNRLLVPISSIEEAAAMSKTYACCTFRGSLAALDLATGKLLWKTSMISEPHKVLREKEGGIAVQGPAGAAVWASPSIDRKRGLVYVTTGDSYTDVETTGDDSIYALEIATGKVRWHRQVTEHDNFVMGCGPRSASGNCPTPLGPDYDFGSTPILMSLPGGHQVLVAGQKSGLVYGLDPQSGALLWKTAVGLGSALGGVEWGMGADDRHVYVPISDISRLFGRPGHPADGKPGLYALNPANGAFVWQAPAPEAACHYAADKTRPSRCIRSISSAPAVIPGVVFDGGLDGWFRAYDSATGKVLWEESTTARTYDTLNGVKDQPGGGIDGLPITVAHGMVYLVSGNNGAAHIGSNGVNVLLAYSVDGN